MSIAGLASGDFNAAYQVSATTNIKGSPDPRLIGVRRFAIDAIRLGPCPIGMPPGAMDVPGAGRFNALTGHVIH